MLFRPVLAIVAALAAHGAPALAQTAEDRFRDALERARNHVEDLVADIDSLDQAPAPRTGLLVPPDADPASAGLLPEQWEPLAASDAPERLVILVHGLDEPGAIWRELAPDLVEAGHRVARFEYPNDQPIAASADLFLEHLRQARAAGVERVAIVAHSMGGLVSFDALTRPDPRGPLPEVTRLITVGTPWQGAPLARLEAVSELHEHIERMLLTETFDLRPLIDHEHDGAGEAYDDLRPGSPFLSDLAERPWPAEIPHTSILGRVAADEPLPLDALAESDLLRRLLGRDGLDELVAGLREDLSEASAAVGDGAVPVDSALARTTDDLHVFPVNHRALLRPTPIDFLTGRADETGTPPAIPIILDRLEADR